MSIAETCDALREGLNRACPYVAPAVARRALDILQNSITAAADLRQELDRLVAAVAAARAAEDAFIRDGDDAWQDHEDAQATLIVCENNARAALAKAHTEQGMS